MVPFNKPAIFLVKVPPVTTGFVVESTTPKPPIVGVGEVLNTTPLAVIPAPPLLVILPPIVAIFVVIPLFVPVTTVGAAGENTSISSIAQPSATALTSVTNLNLNLTFDCPEVPGN